MQQIASAIREGAEAFMARQYKTIAIMAVVLAAVLYAGYRMYAPTAPVALRVVFSFLVGAACSGISGYTGMFVSIRANLRTAAAARTRSRTTRSRSDPDSPVSRAARPPSGTVTARGRASGISSSSGHGLAARYTGANLAQHR